MRSIIVAMVLLLLSSNTYAMTTSTKVGGKISNQQQKTFHQNITKRKILLLDWQGEYLQTTAGTVHTRGITINNFTGLPKEKLHTLKNLPTVIFKKDGNNTIVHIDIVSTDK